MEHKDWLGHPRACCKKAGELGLTSVDIPESYGGLEMDKVSSAIIADHIAKYAGFATTWGGHTGIGTLPIVYFGTEEQKKKYLPRLAAGEIVGAYALVRSLIRLRRAQLPHPRRAFARRQALHPERREDVDHQRRLRRPVHRLRQSRRREVHCVSGRERLPRLLHRRGRTQDGHPRLLHLPAHPQRLQSAGGKRARRNRQGPHHRLQHPERRPLQAGRHVRRRRARFA